MPIILKRIEKYFTNADGSLNPLFEQTETVDAKLLRTIKLSKNVFKLSLPNPAYDNKSNFATIPGSQVPKPKERSESRLKN